MKFIDADDWRDLYLTDDEGRSLTVAINPDNSGGYISLSSDDGFEAIDMSRKKLRKFAKAILKETKKR